ncbi:hypothetical protein RHMOL_Rhmol09G0053800 [Rhododendron molle]|uniref:Uncharacterized protein n=1 Tax=Rhododendron molle TaxID=49168 RepID=A0ACC0MAF4_RHOML|nr:hypothetical protein RHMOL_Rhmol09G0053800 [Rhododendron molle]
MHKQRREETKTDVTPQKPREPVRISHVKIILSVVGSVILISRRQSSEVYPTSWRNLWKEWQLQGLVLLSLRTPLILIRFEESFHLWTLWTLVPTYQVKSPCDI